MDKWKLTAASADIKRMKKREALWTQGNGYMGIRASFDEQYPSSVRSTLINGVFDSSADEPTELVALPDCTNFEIEVGGEHFTMLAGGIDDYGASLDMKTGEFKRELVWNGNGGSSVRFEFLRMVSVDNKHIVAQKVRITLLSDDAQVKIITGIDGKVTNTGVQHFNSPIKQAYADGSCGLYAKTVQSDVTVAIHFALKCSKECRTANSIDRRSIFKKAELNLKKGETVTFEKITSYATSRDFEYISASPTDEVLYGDGKRYLCDALRCGYDVLKRRDSDVRAKYWEENLACVDSGNDFIDRAVVFAQYHLSIMASPDDNRLGIGAKGLSGMGYMGHSFWDTELFLFPYYLYTSPDAARRLLEYRYRLIDVAKAKAKKHGYLGAMYPWESAWIDDGEASLEYGDLDLVTGKRRKFEMAETEIHITAGIAYAVWQYYIATGDDEFMEKCGNELVVLTALFFASRACFKNGRYEICGVIGPDEYKENVDNNAYTNYMAHRNLRIADKILKNCPKELHDKIDVEYGFEAVCRRISEVLEGLYLPKEESDGIISQFDGCKNLKPIDIEHYKKLGKVCAIFGDYGFDEILKMQVYKQADLVMLFYVMDELFSIDSMRRNFEYYEKRTIHDSSLSLCIHSLVAARLKMYGLADDMFYRSCCVDIGDNTDNSDEGIHSASIGGIWLALVMGYGGVRVNENGFFVNAVLPEGWNVYSFFMTYRNTRFKLTVTRDGCTAERIYGQPVPICVNGEEITV